MIANLAGFIRTYLPNAERHGDEYYIGSHRGEKGQSFHINIKTGCFYDFADNAVKGGVFDFVSLIINGRTNRREGISLVNSYLSGKKVGLDKEILNQPLTATAINYNKRSSDNAVSIWDKSVPVNKNKVVQQYLNNRKIFVDSAALRAAYLKHKSGSKHNCLVAALTDKDNKVAAVHRIYLDDSGNKAAVSPNKMALGNVRGAAVKLFIPKNILGIAEGIETAISAYKLTGIPTWSAISGANLANVPIPDNIKTIVIFTDNDKEGIKYAQRAEQVYLEAGYSVRVIKPTKKDFNDDIIAA